MSEPLIAETVAAPLSDAEFKKLLTAIIPHLRAYARSLCGDRTHADDLVQETMVKAWRARQRFEAGTNFRGWTFTILRNIFLSEARRKKFVGEWDDLAAERHLSTTATQDRTIELTDVLRALQELPPAQREAIALVGAGGISYEEAAEIMQVAVGTIKSRVCRARAALSELLANGQLAQTRAEFEPAGDAITVLSTYLENGRARLTALYNGPGENLLAA